MGEKSGLTIFDIDDTLFHTECKLHLHCESGFIRSIDANEFNTFVLPPDHWLDYSEFESAEIFFNTAKPVENVFTEAQRILSETKRSPGSKMIILTARGDLDQKELFLSTFRKHGFDIDSVYVERAGNLPGHSHESKQVIIDKYLSTGHYARVRFFDDNEMNLTYFLHLQKKFPSIKFTAYLVKEGKISDFTIAN